MVADMAEVATSAPGVRDNQRIVFEASLMWPWIVANCVAFTIAGAIGGGVFRALLEPSFGRDFPVMEAARIQATAAGFGGAIHGLIIGTAQWLVLRRSIRAGWWMPATVVGWTLAGSLMAFSAGGSTSHIGPRDGPINPFIAILLLPPLLALILGAGQWLILRREAAAVGWWPFVSAGAQVGAWFAGLIVAKLLPWVAGTMYPSGRALAVVGLITGPLYAWLTWQFLAQLRRRAAGPEVS